MYSANINISILKINTGWSSELVSFQFHTYRWKLSVMLFFQLALYTLYFSYFFFVVGYLIWLIIIIVFLLEIL